MRFICNIFIFFIFSLLFYSCSFTKKIKEPEDAFTYKQYSLAIELLTSELEKSPESFDSRKAYLLAKCYEMTSDYDNALNWMKKSLDSGYNPLAFRDLGMLYKMNEDYDKANEAFKEYGVKTNSVTEAEREIRICMQLKEWEKLPTEYNIDKIFENSLSADYSPALYENDFLIFSSDRQLSEGSDRYLWTGEKFSDLFIMLKNGSDVRKFDIEINSMQNEGTACFTKDFSTLFFTRCFTNGIEDAKCKLMKSERIDGFFTKPVTLNFIQDGYNYGHPALFENDSILIFSSDLNDPGKSYDLFYSELDDNGNWSVPETFPTVINSPGNEKFPTTHNDTLYFSSDYMPGFGGLDIFKTYLKKDRSWATPVNMRKPINSGGDDFGFIVDDNARLTGNMMQKGYFSSVRKDTEKEDIFIFTRRPLGPPIETAAVTDKSDKSDKRTLYLAGKTLEPYYTTEDDPSSVLKGNRLLTGVNIRIQKDDSKIVFQGNTGSSGVFATEIEEGKTYKITANKNGYLNKELTLSITDIPWQKGQNSYTMNADVVLQKLFRNTEITLQNIYYDFDKWNITPDAIPTLNELAELLRVNPQIRIQLSSHTDCRGDSSYNQILSQKRAQSAVDFLISKGVSYERLSAKGYGEDNLLIKCECTQCSEEEHQLNRRTTFTILD